MQKLVSNNTFQLARIKTSVNDNSWTKLGSNNNHEVILVNRIEAFEIFVAESYGRETSWLLYVDAVDVDIPNDVEMTLIKAVPESNKHENAVTRK